VSDWEPPRCGHGRILGGCSFDDCPEQVAWLRLGEEAHERWVAKLRSDTLEYLNAPAGAVPPFDDVAHRVWVGTGGCPSTRPEDKRWCVDRCGHAGFHHAPNTPDPSRPIGADNPRELEWR
jgi:hypothetical protein